MEPKRRFRLQSVNPTLCSTTHRLAARKTTRGRGAPRSGRPNPVVLPAGDRWPLKSRRRFDPVDVLHYAIEELGHGQAELADILGSRLRAFEVLARRRPLILEMIQKITASWKIPADLLARPYRVAATAA